MANPHLAFEIATGLLPVSVPLFLIAYRLGRIAVDLQLIREELSREREKE